MDKCMSGAVLKLLSSASLRYTCDIDTRNILILTYVGLHMGNLEKLETVMARKHEGIHCCIAT